MAYEAYCAACTYLSENADCGRYWCERKGEYHYASDPKCGNFCEAYSRYNSARENMYHNSADSGSSCYLTTIMCDILGYPDNNYYLNVLRNFRDYVMKTNSKYIPLLYTYDIVGPMIAYELSKDKDKKVISQVFFDKYITKSVSAIEAGKNQTAIDIYTSMTSELAKKYNINMNIVSPKISEIDMNTLGHAKVRKLGKNNI